MTDTLEPEAKAHAYAMMANEAQQHVKHAHLLIDRLRKELRTLNEVIARRKHVMRELRQRIAEAKQYHFSVPDDEDKVCHSCRETWPCVTYVALQPSVLEQGPQ